MRIKGRVFRYRGAKVKAVESAIGFVDGGPRRWWVEALEPCGDYEVGEQFTVGEKQIRKELSRRAKG